MIAFLLLAYVAERVKGRLVHYTLLHHPASRHTHPSRRDTHHMLPRHAIAKATSGHQSHQATGTCGLEETSEQLRSCSHQILAATTLPAATALPTTTPSDPGHWAGSKVYSSLVTFPSWTFLSPPMSMPHVHASRTTHHTLFRAHSQGEGARGCKGEGVREGARKACAPWRPWQRGSEGIGGLPSKQPCTSYHQTLSQRCLSGRWSRLHASAPLPLLCASPECVCVHARV